MLACDARVLYRGQALGVADDDDDDVFFLFTFIWWVESFWKYLLFFFCVNSFSLIIYLHAPAVVVSWLTLEQCVQYTHRKKGSEAKSSLRYEGTWFDIKNLKTDKRIAKNCACSEKFELKLQFIETARARKFYENHFFVVGREQERISSQGEILH